MKTLLIALILAGTATPALAAEDWVHFFNHDDGSISHYDRRSLSRSGDVVRVWARWDRTMLNDTPLREGRIHEEVNCGARTVRVLAFRGYGAERQVIADEVQPGEVEAIAPNTVAQALFEHVCTAAAPATTS